MSELPPTAQAVISAAMKDAYGRPSTYFYSRLAAAFRAAVDEVAPEKTIEDIDYVHQNYVDGYRDALYEILIIANELELVSISDTLH